MRKRRGVVVIWSDGQHPLGTAYNPSAYSALQAMNAPPNYAPTESGLQSGATPFESSSDDTET
jgi:hypothetical protein